MKVQKVSAKYKCESTHFGKLDSTSEEKEMHRSPPTSANRVRSNQRNAAGIV